MSDFYTRLAVSPTATPDEIRAAYDRLRAQYLVADNDPKAQQQIQEIEEAYTILSDPQRRVEYDQILRKTASTASHPSFNLTTLSVNTLDNSLAVNAPRQTCQHCGASNPTKAMRCSNCGVQIARSCPSCGIRVDSDQSECSRCGTVIAEYDYQRYADATMTHQRIQQQRKETEQRGAVLDHLHEEDSRAARTFWTITAIIGFIIFLFVLFLAYWS